MLTIKSIRRKCTKSGQINIAETVVAVTIILVLAVSVAQLGSKVALSQQTSSIDRIQKKAQDSLDLALSLGYLRNLTYSQTSVNKKSVYYNYTLNLILENLPSSAQFSLYQSAVNNPTDPFNNRILLGLSPIPSGNLNIFSVSVLVSGYFSYPDQPYTTAYIVTLLVALGNS